MRSSPARSMKRPHWCSTSTARVYATSTDFIRERANCPWTESEPPSIRYPHCLIRRYLKLPALRLRSVSAQSTSSARLKTCPKAITVSGSISRAPLSPAFSSATPRLSKPPCILSRHRRVPWCTGRASALVAVHPLRRRRGLPVALCPGPDPGRSRAAAIRRWRRPGPDRYRPLPRDLRPPLR